MAEGRHSLDRLQRKRRQFTFADVHLGFPSGELGQHRGMSRAAAATTGLNSMMSSNLACHSAGLSVHDILTDIELDSPAGHMATSKHVCLLRFFLTQILIRKHWTANFTTKEKITKTRPWSGRGQRRGEIRQHDEGTLLLSFAFFFLIRLLHTLCV